MFLIAGISPKTKILDTIPRRCPLCGLSRAYFKRVDHYFSIFFIPVLRIKKGEPFIMCEKCEMAVHEMEKDFQSQQTNGKFTCKYCSRRLQKGFKFCPFCGKPV
jgi:hypothetical protein